MKSEEYEYREYDWEREYEVLAERAQEYAYQQLERDSQGIKAINYYRPAIKYKTICNNKNTQFWRMHFKRYCKISKVAPLCRFAVI